VDAGFSSLATFAAGLFAVRELGAEELGAYALVFTAYVFVTVFPKQLVFVPSEVFAVERDRGERVLVLRDSFRLVAPVALVSSFALAGWLLVAPSEIEQSTLLALTLTGIAVSLVVPFVEHLRTVLHIARRSWTAAMLSVVYFFGTVTSIAGLALGGIATPWIPFGGMCLGGLLTLVIGFLTVGREILGRRASTRPEWKSLVHFGGWLLVTSVLPRGAAFVAATLVSNLASPALLGMAEAARVASSPITVMGVALTVVLGPQLMEAAQRADYALARKVGIRFLAIGITGGVAYLLLFGWDWGGNVLAVLVPRAYEIMWLVPATIAANILFLTTTVHSRLFIGARKRVELLRVEALGSVGVVAAGLSASWTGAFAIPTGSAISAMLRTWRYRTNLNRIFHPEKTKMAESGRIGPEGRSLPIEMP